MKTDKLIKRVAEVFNHGLPSLMGHRYERRPLQLAMAGKVAESIGSNKVAVIEAGTGLGKSLAYLIPLIVYCQSTGARAVVSTYTRNLQRQLHSKDFPAASAAAGVIVEHAVLLGRANYACRRNIMNLLAEDTSGSAFSSWLRDVLDASDGDLENQKDSSMFLDASNRLAVSCPLKDAACSGCRERETCFLVAARRRALDSQVVLVNHALLFSNLAAGGALLGPHDVLVIDEAHHLEEVATQFLTLSYGPRSVRGAQQSAYSPEYEELIAYARDRIAVESIESGERIAELWKRYHQFMNEGDRLSKELFDVLGKNVERVRTDGDTRHDPDQAPVIYGEGAPVFYGTEILVADLASAWTGMVDAAGGILEITQVHEDSLNGAVRGSIKSVRDVAAETLAEFQFLTSGAAEDHVFYISTAGDGRAVKLTASPIDVGPRLGVMLEEGTSSAVLTSATLAVDENFSFVLERLGLDRSDRVFTCRYDSPFDLEAQRTVLVASYLPDPGSGDFLAQACRTIHDGVRAAGKRTVVLCTAKSQIPALVSLLSTDENLKEKLFVQQEGSSRADLLDRFKRTPGGILLGLVSFWEGVDLPGDLLELLVILKLPFQVPTEPVVQARSRRLVDAGDDPFTKMFLPDVILKLRQGMGRLIRTGSDRGVVIILDSRLWHSSYGKYILDAAAVRYDICDDREVLVGEIKKHL